VTQMQENARPVRFRNVYGKRSIAQSRIELAHYHTGVTDLSKEVEAMKARLAGRGGEAVGK